MDPAFAFSENEMCLWVSLEEGLWLTGVEAATEDRDSTDVGPWAFRDYPSSF